VVGSSHLLRSDSEHEITGGAVVFQAIDVLFGVQYCLLPEFEFSSYLSDSFSRITVPAKDG